MSERADVERILASLHDAALDPSHWAGAFALIDETLRVHSTATVFGGGGPAGDIGIQLAWFYARGQRPQRADGLARRREPRLADQ